MRAPRIARVLGRLAIKKPYRLLLASVNGLGNKHKCYICGRTFDHFTPYRKKSPSPDSFFESLGVIGGGVDYFGCVFCNSHDRERHMFMFLDKLQMWQEFNDAAILHIAPEKNLPTRIRRMKPSVYIMGDLYPASREIVKLQVTDLDFPDSYFDFVICNHVLEHVPNDARAMQEILRVLKPGGKAILQTPFSSILEKTLEDPSIDSDELRLKFYGETSHCRVYGTDLFEKLEGTGFKLDIIRSDHYFSRQECEFYGVNYEENLILVQKPNCETAGPTTRTLGTCLGGHAALR